jgi:hypothetical protein
MSNIFLKNKKVNGNVSEFLDTETVSTASLPQWLSVVDVPQKGGNDHEASPSSTTTAALEDKLREIFATPTQAQAPTQAGGKRMKKSKKVDVTEDGAAKKPYKKASKKSSKKASKKSSKKASKKSSKKAKRVKKSSKKASKKSSKKASKKSSKKASKKSSKKASKKGSKKMTGGKKASKKGSKKMSGVKKASKKSSKKGSKAKRVKKASKKSSKKASNKSSKKASKKSSKKASKKSSKKASKKSSKKASKKSSKKASKKGSKKAKRSAPAHAALMVEVIKMIVVKDSINYPAAMKKLGTYIAKAIGKPYEKGGDITYIDALKKTKTMLNK